jgi:arylformamidase
MRNCRAIILMGACLGFISAPCARGQDFEASPDQATVTGRGSGGTANRMVEMSNRRLQMRQMLEQRARAMNTNSIGIGSSARDVGTLKFAEGDGPKARAAAAAIDKTKVTVRSHVPYGKEFRQDLDVYSPAHPPAGGAPAIIFLHGGGWRIGNKSMHIDKGSKYAENGVVFVSINYRLAPETMHPKQVEDAAAAFAWVHAHATEIGADPNRIFIMGHSAGAHLVDLLGTNDRFLRAQKLTLKDVKGVISLDTASLNLIDRMAEKSQEGQMMSGMIKGAFGTDEKVLTDASPLAAIKPGKYFPPFLMFCSNRRMTCMAQHKVFAEALTAVGGKVSVKPVPLSHAQINQQAGQPGSDIWQHVMTFVGTVK